MLTKEEFDKYVESFQKKPGEYTEEEILKIGLKLKELPVRERHWAELIKLLGITYSTDALRKRVDRYGEYIARSKVILDDKALEYSLQYNDNQKTRDWYNAIRKDIRSDTRVQNLKDEIQYAANKLKEIPLEIKEIEYKPKKDTEAILMLSDWHIGQEANNFYNTYNPEIAKERVEKLISEVIYYCNTHRIETLHVLNLGDLIEGIINTNARIEQQMDVAEQLMYASELLAQCLSTLSKNIKRVTYRSVSDNHSRIIPDKHQHIERENLFRITDWFIKERLKKTSIEFIDDNLDIGLGLFDLKNGMKVAFMHGHEDMKAKMLQNVVGATHQWVDVVCCGHYHNPAEHTFQDMRLYVNGSICGTGPYALKNRLFTKPSQKLLIFDQNICDIDITL